MLGVSRGVRLLSRGFRSAHCIEYLLIALMFWQISVVAFVGSHDVQTWRTLGTLGAATCVLVLARRVGALGAANLIYRSFVVIFATVADELAISPSTAHQAVKGLMLAGLVRKAGHGHVADVAAMEEFLLHEVRYAFPAIRTRRQRGVPTRR